MERETGWEEAFQTTDTVEMKVYTLPIVSLSLLSF